MLTRAVPHIQATGTVKALRGITYPQVASALSLSRVRRGVGRGLHAAGYLRGRGHDVPVGPGLVRAAELVDFVVLAGHNYAARDNRVAAVMRRFYLLLGGGRLARIDLLLFGRWRLLVADR